MLLHPLLSYTGSNTLYFEGTAGPLNIPPAAVGIFVVNKIQPSPYRLLRLAPGLKGQGILQATLLLLLTSTGLLAL